MLSQPLVHNYISPLLLKEVRNYQIEAVDPEALLKKLFPDEALPQPVDATYATLLKAEAPILHVDADSTNERVWCFFPTGRADISAPSSNEQQVADFFQDIANAAFATYKVKPDFVRALSGR